MIKKCNLLIFDNTSYEFAKIRYLRLYSAPHLLNFMASNTFLVTKKHLQFTPTLFRYWKSPDMEYRGCPYCKDGKKPGGAHRCIKCNTPVHVISDQCSTFFESSAEGHGQKRICHKCEEKCKSRYKCLYNL